MSKFNGVILTSSLNLIIIGTGGHSRVIADAAMNSGFNLTGFLDLNYKGQDEKILGCDVLGGLSFLDTCDTNLILLVIAVGDNNRRSNLSLKLKDKGFSIQTVIHPTAIVSKYCTIGEGCFINAGTIVNAGVVVDDGCILNTGVIVDHECKIGRYCHLAPGVKIAGRTTIDNYSFIGIGATLIESIKIGANVTIGAGSVVINDINSNTTVMGVPAKAKVVK
jgi:sugar O-acyltransferase (sialic acid O-acetyltransferase NeuD family)